MGRLRRFVEGYPTLALKPGDGKAPHISGDSGWSASYALPADQAELISELKCEGGTWSDQVGTNNALPATCVSFNVAYAFCIWDGGRLPTNAEWNFAAAGGDEQRIYPWGSNIDETYAIYGAVDGLPPSVGTKPLGNGRWGQTDLGGGVVEWALDYHQDEYSPAFCDDCVNLTASTDRIVRGGSYLDDAQGLFAAYARSEASSLIAPNIGFRCARDMQSSKKLD